MSGLNLYVQFSMDAIHCHDLQFCFIIEGSMQLSLSVCVCLPMILVSVEIY